VAVKDNIAVGGVPLMNGSAVLDGYVPSRTRPSSPACWRPARRSPARPSARRSATPARVTRATRTGAQPVRSPPFERRLVERLRRALADRQVDLAIGGDQGGSIRCPSSWSGVVGLKPTYGLVPYTGAFRSR
jgi:amidase